MCPDSSFSSLQARRDVLRVFTPMSSLKSSLPNSAFMSLWLSIHTTMIPHSHHHDSAFTSPWLASSCYYDSAFISTWLNISWHHDLASCHRMTQHFKYLGHSIQVLMTQHSWHHGSHSDTMTQHFTYTWQNSMYQRFLISHHYDSAFLLPWLSIPCTVTQHSQCHESAFHEVMTLCFM